MDRPALLDVNVLIALFDQEHVHHELSHDWFSDNRRDGWATCPVTENGFLRVLSNPAYSSALHRLPDLMLRLRRSAAIGIIGSGRMPFHFEMRRSSIPRWLAGTGS